MKSLTEQVHEYICKNDTQFSSEELANMVRYFTQEQAKEIEELNEVLKILFKHRIEQEKLIASISKQSLVEDLNDMHIARSIQKARDHRKFGENK